MLLSHLAEQGGKSAVCSALRLDHLLDIHRLLREQVVARGLLDLVHRGLILRPVRILDALLVGVRAMGGRPLSARPWQPPHHHQETPQQSTAGSTVLPSTDHTAHSGGEREEAAPRAAPERRGQQRSSNGQRRRRQPDWQDSGGGSQAAMTATRQHSQSDVRASTSGSKRRGQRQRSGRRGRHRRGHRKTRWRRPVATGQRR